MIFRTALPIIIVLFAPLVRAADPPEKLLPASTQLYVRWDGIQAHQAAYDNSAGGKVYTGDTGGMIHDIGQFALDEWRDHLLGKGLSAAQPPENLEKISADFRSVVQLPALLAKRGFLIGGEFSKPGGDWQGLLARTVDALRMQMAQRLFLPDFRLVMIVPNAAGEAEPLFAALRLLTVHDGLTTDSKQILGRNVTSAFSNDLPGRIAWWIEGEHVAVYAGTVPLDAVIKQMQSAGPGLTANPLYQKAIAFREFKPITRGFVDNAALMQGLAKVLPSNWPQTWAYMETFGITAVKTITFQSGFDGLMSRDWLEFDCVQNPPVTPGILKREPLKFTELPPLPADAIHWSALRADFDAVYDLVLSFIAVPSNENESQGKTNLAAFLRGRRDDLEASANQTLNLRLRQELVSALGDKLVTYSSPGENIAGIFGSGQVFLFSLRDEQKAKAALAQLSKNLVSPLGTKPRVRIRSYRGIDIYEHYFGPATSFAPSYAICNGWLAFSFFPQPVQGFVLRCQGKLPAWTPDAHTAKVFVRQPADAVGMMYTDPAAELKQILPIAPALVEFVRATTRTSRDAKPAGTSFEIGSIPNAHEATQLLFPNVNWLRNDGKSFRLDCHSSVGMPLNFVGPDTVLGVGLLVSEFFLPGMKQLDAKQTKK
ncbi:MAG TPA: hypothetical protein VKS79_18970 [Gemmataceae bacterium]|nr:hypothetical protein [Gemmataceae bacterium]